MTEAKAREVVARACQSVLGRESFAFVQVGSEAQRRGILHTPAEYPAQRCAPSPLGARSCPLRSTAR
jgi:hypothetical protein